MIEVATKIASRFETVDGEMAFPYALEAILGQASMMRV